MSNLCDDSDAVFHVLVNDEGQYSRWAAATRCIEEHLLDVRPVSLVRAITGGVRHGCS